MRVTLASVLVAMAMLGCQGGTTGAQGPTGPAGATGATGAAGPQGPQGAPGPQGPEGPAGAAGSVVVLAAADGGTISVDGGVVIIAGPMGAQGASGPTGATGPQGPTGAIGSPGATGATGAQGPAGPVGPAGAIKILSADGGVAAFAFSPELFWSPQSKCFFERQTQYIADYVEFDGQGCTGQAFFSGGPLSTPSSGAAIDLRLRCFSLPTVGNFGTPRPGRLARPAAEAQMTIRSVLTRTGQTSSGTCQNVADYPTPAVLFADAPAPANPLSTGFSVEAQP